MHRPGHEVSDWRRTSFAPIPAGDLPEGLVLFDGACVLCSGWVTFVLARDATQRFRFTSIQGPYGRELAQRFGLDLDDPQSNAIILDGQVLFKSDSALGVLGVLPGWRWTRMFKLLPRSLRDWVYDRMARNRYALFGSPSQCMLPTPEQRDRFIL